MKERYAANPDLKKVQNKAQKYRVKEWVEDYKVEKGCAVCDEIDYTCLEFHHVDAETKENEISVMVNNKCSKEKLLAEMEKCIVVCASDHRKIHSGSILVILN